MNLKQTIIKLNSEKILLNREIGELKESIDALNNWANKDTTPNYIHFYDAITDIGVVVLSLEQKVKVIDFYLKNEELLIKKFNVSK